MDMRQATEHLGLTFKGYPETPVTQQTYESAVNNGILRDWKDGAGNAASAPTWAAIETAFTESQAAEAAQAAREKDNERKREKLKAHLSQEDNTINSVLALRERVEMLEEFIGLREPRDL